MTRNTITDLKTSGGSSSNEMVTVLGYHSVGDGGGGDFYWDPLSTVKENGGTIFHIGPSEDEDPEPGRWIRVQTFPVNVKWFGAKGLNTDDTNYVQNALDYCRTSGVRRRLLFPDGTYILGKVDITGVWSLEGMSNKVWIRGKAEEDIFYWKASGEADYVRINDLTIKNFNITLETTKDCRQKNLRVGFAGERIGNCAIHLPGEGINYLFEDVYITKSGGGTKAAYGGCGVFFSGAPYKLNVNGRLEIRSVDYGFVVGVSDKHSKLVPREIFTAGINDANNTFSCTPLPANGEAIALLYDINERQLVDEADNSTLAIRPRKRYFVRDVDTTAGTFKLAATATGPAIAFTKIDNPDTDVNPDAANAALPPQTFVIPAREHANSIEFAGDEWSVQQLITAQTMRCGFSAANIYQCAFGAFGCQSSRVAFRLMNYDSRVRYAAANVSFDELYTEGPFDTPYMQNREYVRIEGFNIKVLNGPLHVTGSAGALNNYLTFDTNYGVFSTIAINNNTRLKVLGDGNIIKGRLMGKDSSLDNLGFNNQITYHRDETGSDSVQSFSWLSRFSLSKEIGGFWPDHVIKGNADAPYQSDHVMFYPAAQQIYFGSPVLLYLTDPALDAHAYIRYTGTAALRLRNPMGSAANTLTIGRFFPKQRWMLYAKVRSTGGSKQVTIAFSDVSGATTYNASASHNVDTSWKVIGVEVNHSSAPATLTGELQLTPATAGLDVAYFVIVPFAGETFSRKTNFGGGIVDLVGSGSPEGTVSAAIGSTYRSINGTAGATLYIKESGTGANGWRKVTTTAV